MYAENKDVLSMPRKHTIGDRMIIMEQTNLHIQQSLARIENKCEKLETKIENSFRWIMTTSLGAFFSLSGLVFTIYQFFK